MLSRRRTYGTSSSDDRSVADQFALSTSHYVIAGTVGARNGRPPEAIIHRPKYRAEGEFLVDRRYLAEIK